MIALGASSSELNDQLAYIQAQIKKITLSWQRAEVTLQLAKKVNIVIYHEAQSDFKDILAREEIISTMDEIIDLQLDAIINGKKPYEAINFLAVYFPTLLPTIQPTDTPAQKDAKNYLSSVVAALTNKEFRSLLGKQLVNKEKRIMKAIKRAAKREEAQLLD